MPEPFFMSQNRLLSFVVAFLLMVALSTSTGCGDALSQGGTPLADSPAQPNDDSGSGSSTTAAGDIALRDRIDAVLDFSAKRYLDTSKHGAWQILHGVLAFGPELRIRHEGQLKRAVDVISEGGMIYGFLLRPTEHGLDSIVQAGSLQGQGHDDQWLAELTQANLNLDFPIRWGEKDYTLGDMLRQAQWDLNANSEATWTLMALATFLPIDAEWDSSDGTTWNFPKLLELEVSRDINDPEISACGGTHRLVGLCLAVNNYMASHPGAKLTGPWAKADLKIQEAITKAKEFQQSDGAFSAQYFVRPAVTPEVEERIGTTGHTLEFLSFAMTKQQFEERWVANAANHLCELLEATKDQPVECGALYHAIHGLQRYRYRIWGPPEVK
ncbi:MAG: ADP-ribosylation factor-directed GTPase activating protein isoform b [Pirellulales bacterium]|nr:ADP-ribosylation factor-directed GTPase activating protein isoform b [Pirellulales bacterium]